MPCRFREDIVFTLKDGAGGPALVVGNPSSVAVDLVLGPAQTALVAATWTNWCGRREGFLSVTSPGSDVSFHVTDLGTPTCEDPSLPSVITVVRASNSSYRFPPNAALPLSPGPARALAFAQHLAAQAASGDPAVFANPSGCGSPANAATERTVCAIHQTNDAGTLTLFNGRVTPLPDRRDLTEEALLAWGRAGGNVVPDLNLLFVEMREMLALEQSPVSVGCAVEDAECGRFVVVLAVRSQPPLAYLVFETADEPGSQPGMTSMGLKGDPNIMLNGGVTDTDLGLTLFTPVK